MKTIPAVPSQFMDEGNAARHDGIGLCHVVNGYP